MITINLLPIHLRKKKLKLPFLSVLPIVGGVFGLLIIISVFLVLAAGCNRRNLEQLTQEKQRLLPRIEEVNKLKQELRKLNQNTAIIDQLIARKFLWAKKLNQLSDSVTPGIWFRKLSLASLDCSLIIEGSVVSRKGEEMASVGKFMAALKAEDLFFKDFKDIELKSIQRRKVEIIEIMDFVLVCYFK